MSEVTHETDMALRPHRSGQQDRIPGMALHFLSKELQEDAGVE